MSLKPICVRCQRFYRPKKNAVFFIEGMPIGNGVPPGTEFPDLWRPYKLWQGDLWECHGCGHELISGVGYRPISEQYYPQFNEDVKAYCPMMQVNDC